MKTIAERLKEAREDAGLTQPALAEKAKVSQGTIGNIESGLRKRPRDLLSIAEALGVSATWLESGNGPKKVKFDANITRIASGARPYPVVSMIQAGHLKEMTNPYEPGDGYDIEFGDDDASEWAVFVEIKGDSMLPDFKPGDRVRIDPEVVPRPGDFVAAKNSELEATFKKYRVRGIGYNGQEVFELVPLNEDYPILRSDEHSLTVIGTMTEHRRKFRRT